MQSYLKKKIIPCYVRWCRTVVCLYLFLMIVSNTINKIKHFLIAFVFSNIVCTRITHVPPTTAMVTKETFARLSQCSAMNNNAIVFLHDSGDKNDTDTDSRQTHTLREGETCCAAWYRRPLDDRCVREYQCGQQSRCCTGRQCMR